MKRKIFILLLLLLILPPFFTPYKAHATSEQNPVEIIGTWNLINKKEYHDTEILQVLPTRDGKINTLSIDQNGTFVNTRYEESRLNFNKQGQKLPQYEMKDGGTTRTVNSWTCSGNLLKLKNRGDWYYELKDNNLWLKDRAENARVIRVFSKTKQPSPLPGDLLLGTWHMTQLKEYHDSEPLQVWPNQAGETNTLQINKDGTHTTINYQKERLNFERHGYNLPQYEIKTGDTVTQKEGHCKAYNNSVLWLEGQDAWAYKLKNDNQELWLQDRADKPNTIYVYSKTPPKSTLPSTELIGTWHIIKQKEYHDSEPLQVWPNQSEKTHTLVINKDGTHSRTDYEQYRLNFNNYGHELSQYQIKDGGTAVQKEGYAKSYYDNVLWLEGKDNCTYELKNDNQELWLKNRVKDANTIYIYSKKSPQNTLPTADLTGTWHMIQLKEYHDSEPFKIWPTEDGKNNTLIINKDGTHTTINYQKERLNLSRYGYEQLQYQIKNEVSEKKEGYAKSYYGDVLRLENQEDWYYELKGNELYLKNRLKDANTIRIYSKTPPQSPLPQASLIGTWNIYKIKWHDSDLHRVTPHEDGNRDSITIDAKGTHSSATYNHSRRQFANEEKTYTTHGDPKKRSGFCRSYFGNVLILENMGTFSYEVNDNELSLKDLPTDPRSIDLYKKVSSPKTPAEGTAVATQPVTSDTKVSGATQEAKTGATSTKTSGTTQGTKTETAGTKTSGTTQEAKTGATGKKTTDSAQEAKTGAAGTKTTGSTQETKTGTTGTKASGTTQGTKTTSPTQKTQTYDEAYDTDIPPFPANLPVPTEEDDYEFMQVYLDYVTTHKEYTILKASAKELGVRIPPGKLEQALDAYRKAYNRYKNMALTRKK